MKWRAAGMLALAVLTGGAIGLHAQPKTSATAVRADKLWAEPYKAEGSTIRIAVFEAGGEPQTTHPQLVSGPNSTAASLVDRAPGAPLRDHATAVTGIIGANASNGAATTGIARKATIYFYSHVLAVATSTSPAQREEDLASFFGSFFRNWADVNPDKWYISNHSYGSDGSAGWGSSDSNTVIVNGVQRFVRHWYWQGVVGTQKHYNDSTVEDPKFGWYGPLAAQLDLFCSLYHDQITVFSAGNARGQGPKPDTNAYRRYRANGTVEYMNAQPAIPVANGANGFDCLEGFKTAKNGIMVGSVGRDGLTWVLAKSSSTGPTDDGRIKPDVVAYGDNIWVLKIKTPTNTGLKQGGGTSYAAPAVTAVLAQLAELWKRNTASEMHSATARALICHTADDLGKAGPDYRFGWGLVNAQAAGALVTLRGQDGRFAVQERSLANKAYDTIYIRAKAAAKVMATIAWADPAGQPIPTHPDGVPQMNNRTRVLVNDLELRIYPITGAGDNIVGVGALPWKLDPESPDTEAKHKDNNVDNIEQVTVTAPATLTATKKGVYMIVVSHEGNLKNSLGISVANAVQDYSLVITGATEYLPAPKSINSMQLTASSSRVNWRAVPNANGYDVEYRAAGSNDWIKKPQTALTQMTFNDLASGTWLFRVRARRSAVLGVMSDPVAFIIGKPSAPTEQYVTFVTPTTAVFNWTGVAGATSYEVAWVPVRMDNTELEGYDFKYETVTETKYKVTGLPPDEYVNWFVRAKVAPSSKSDYSSGNQFATTTDCASYEPGNNEFETARIARINEYFTGRMCKNDKVDRYRIEADEFPSHKYLLVTFDKHSKPYSARLYRHDRQSGGFDVSIVANTNITLSATEQRQIYYTSLDHSRYDYYLEIESPSPATVYSDSERYGFWIESSSTPFGARRGDGDPSMSMKGGEGNGRSLQPGESIIEQTLTGMAMQE